jgi:hypothetical protein
MYKERCDIRIVQLNIIIDLAFHFLSRQAKIVLSTLPMTNFETEPDPPF